MRTTLISLCCLAAGIYAAELPPTYVCGKADTAPIIDGRGDDAVWQTAREFSPLRDIEGEPLPHECRIRMVYDEDYLYILADMDEPHLRALLTKHDSIIYHDPDFEVFIDPDGDGLNYIELEINALNTTWDLFITRPYRFNSPYILHDWEIPGLKHAVSLRGTLNQSDDTDDGWSVELAIPWCSITGHAHHPRKDSAPQAGTVMRFNFSRVNHPVKPNPKAAGGYSPLTDANGHPLPESNHVWAPTGKINIHLPEHWGKVLFSARSSAEWESAMPDPQEKTLQSLFQVLNQQLEIRGREGVFDRTAALPEGVDLQFLNDGFFVLTAECKTTGIRMSLDSEGRFHRSAARYRCPEIFLWVHGNRQCSEQEWEAKFRRFAAAGIDTVIIGDGAEQVRTLLPLAQKAGLKVFAWFWALNRPMDKETLRHPEWFAVNAEGKSCFNEKDRPFVPYYQFLCPNNDGVRRHLIQEIRNLADIPGLAGIQADYMRMPDVRLPRGLWDKYGLDMNRPAPKFDYCYCGKCRALFREQYGREPLAAPAKDREWEDFRLNSVAALYNELAGEIRKRHLHAACAVFPAPGLAAEMVRQDWKRFHADLVLPMAYHSFYEESPEWDAAITRRAAEESGHRIPLAPGIHLPDAPQNELAKQLNALHATGVHGISLFSDEEITDAQLQSLRQWKDSLRTPTDNNQ